MRFSRKVEEAIADFRGLPRPVPQGPAPTPLDSIIEVLVERHSIGQMRPEQSLMANWRELMGDSNAHRCSPERIDANGVLLISVNNPILRRELQFNRRKLLDRIRALPSCDAIRGVEFRAG